MVSDNMMDVTRVGNVADCTRNFQKKIYHDFQVALSAISTKGSLLEWKIST